MSEEAKLPRLSQDRVAAEDRLGLGALLPQSWL